MNEFISVIDLSLDCTFVRNVTRDWFRKVFDQREEHIFYDVMSHVLSKLKHASSTTLLLEFLSAFGSRKAGKRSWQERVNKKYVFVVEYKGSS